MKNQTVLLFFVCFNFLDTLWFSQAELNRTTRDVDSLDEVHVGVILDMGSWQGKVIESCISMAISDFYNLQEYYKVRVVFHVRDSQGDPFRALSAALTLAEDAKVGAILGVQTSLEAKFLAEFGDRNKIPVISFSKSSSFSMSTKSPFFVQIGEDHASQVKGVAALIELYQWRNVILIYEENDDLNTYDDTIPYMGAFFEEKNIQISFTSAIAASSEDYQIIEHLHELKTLQTTVFIVHLSHFLATRFFVNAKRLGMISKGYAWIVTSKSMNHFNSRDSFTTESMHGVIGFRSYIPASRELQNFTSRLRRKIYAEAPDAMQAMKLNILGYLAYDVAWSLAKAADKAMMKAPCSSNLDDRSNTTDLDICTTSIYGSILLQEILRSNFKGLGGEFRFINGKLISNTFEIVNVMHSGERRVGFCTSTGRIKREIYESNHRRQLSFTNNLESITWPGEVSTIPQGRMLQRSGKILKIGVPVKEGFHQLVKVSRDPHTNATNVTGFCIDVFKAALEGLNYQVQYKFIPFMDDKGKRAGTYYNDLIYQVYLQNFDAVVGDTTITAKRSLYVDFTISYTDIGVGIVAPTKNNDLWIFFKPLTPQLWLTTIGFLIIIGFFIWLIEHQSLRHHAEGLPLERNGFPFSMLVGRWDHLRNTWSILVAAVSLFVLFILSSSYTATLASMMTVQHIELNSKRSYIGHPTNSNITTGVLINNLNFENRTIRSFHTEEEFANALSEGSKKGGVSAILDEIPYIKIFLAQYPADFSLIKSLPITNGFAFVFRKGSPLVPNISREIARLRESGRLNTLENEWFKSQTSVSSGGTTDNVRPLTPTNFGGLFLISGTLALVAFLIFQIPFLYQYWHFLRNWMINSVTVWRQVDLYFKKIFLRIRTVQSAITHPQVQMTELQENAL